MFFLMVQTSIAGPKNDTGQITGTMIDKASGNPVTDVLLVLWGCSDWDPDTQKYTMTAIMVNDKFPYSVGCDEKGVFSFIGLPDGGYLIQQQIRGMSMGNPIMFKGSPCIEVKKGGTRNIGIVMVTRENK